MVVAFQEASDLYLKVDDVDVIGDLWERNHETTAVTFRLLQPRPDDEWVDEWADEWAGEWAATRDVSESIRVLG